MKGKAIFLALAAALCYSINIPLSKLLLENAGSCMTAGFLYLGAGISIGMMSLLKGKKKKAKLTRKDLPYTTGMVVLDIAAPIFLMIGLRGASASLATLINNFEIVATSLIAAVFFRERITGRGWASIALITLSTVVLSLSGSGDWRVSPPLLLVLLATVCWGLENNCTRMISSKDTGEIVTIKGLFSGTGSVIVALLTGESFPEVKYIILTLLLGSVAYGLSIFLYIKAQNIIGAASTSSFYAVNPFLGSLLSFVILKEAITPNYVTALIIMIVGTSLMVRDTLAATR